MDELFAYDERRGFKCTHTHTEWGPWAIFNANMHNTLVTTGRQVVFIFFDTTMKLGSIQLNINFSEVTQAFTKPTSYD